MSTILKTEVEVNRTMINKIKENMEKKGDNYSEKEKSGAYYETLPEGITKEQRIEISKHDDMFIESVHVAAAELATDAFKEDPEAMKSVAKFGLCRGYVETVVHKEKTYPNNFAKEGEDKTITKHLQITAKYQTGSGRGLNALRDQLSQAYKK